MRQLLALIMLCLCAFMQAQNIAVGDVFTLGDDMELTVREIRMGKYIYMSDEWEDCMITLAKVDGMDNVYILEPSRQADEPLVNGMQFGWPVVYVIDDGGNYLAMSDPQGNVIGMLMDAKTVVPREPYYPNRDEYHFVTTFGTDEDGCYSTITIEGYGPGKDYPCERFDYDLMNSLEVEPKEEERSMWLDDTTDINFDGFPDLQVYLGFNSTAYVGDYWAGLVWDEQEKCFLHVLGYDSLCNPVLDPVTKTVSTTIRTGNAQLTTLTYSWQDNNLVLIKQTTSDI